jgi:alcohol dehydrogenase (cytochrome c)
MLKHAAVGISLTLLLALALAAQQTPVSQPESSDPDLNLRDVTFRDIRDGFKNTSRWLTYSGDYSGQRHSPLKQITPDNVSKLEIQWTFEATGMARGRGFEATPLLVDGVLFITGTNNWAWAIDARTGKQIWNYRRQLPTGLTYGGGNIVNRGFGMLGNSLFMATLDAHVIALNRDNGNVLWDTTLADFKLGHAATLAPLVVKDKVIVGNSGGDMPTKGFIDAYDARTGKRVWRFNTVPEPGEAGGDTWPAPEIAQRGGGAAWVTGSYDPDLNLLYWGTGNPIPDYDIENRKGDNLFTASIVALDADTGKLKWHFQFTPQDSHDWDANQIPILADITLQGRQRKVVMVASRNGFFYIFDRAKGDLLLAKPFTATQWAREIGPDGRPIVLNTGFVPPGGSEATTPCVPDNYGGANFPPPSFDSARKLFFVMSRETCAVYIRQDQQPQPGRLWMGGVLRRTAAPGTEYSAVRAIDVATGQVRWEYKVGVPSMAGVTSTASGVVFAGSQEGNFNALDAATGKLLWTTNTGANIYGAAATTFMLDGRQWVLIPSGLKLIAFALPKN